MIISSIDLTFSGILVCGPLYYLFWGAVGLLWILHAVHFCMVLPMFLRLVLSILHFLCESSTWRLDSCPLGDTWYGVILWVFEFIVWVLKQSEWVFYSRASLFVAPYWRAIKMAKQLSTATTLLCFGFFWCRVDVLQSIFSRSTISFAEFSGTSQAVSSRPTEVHG